jgi:hypothetical protein
MITATNTPKLPGWIDLGSPDPAASAEFYRKVFGWSATSAGGSEEAEQSDYSMLSKDGAIVGGLGGLQDPKAQSEWTVYVRTPDIAATVNSCESLGGATRVPPMQIGEEGSLAQVTDPTGAEFAVWQPGSFAGVGRACEDDSLLWVELYSSDPERAKGFYGELFDWKTAAFPMPEGRYDVWTTNPGADSEGFGGMMQRSEELPVDKDMWIPYFMVADTDATVAKAVEAGGKVLMPATDGPPGRLAALTDQFGAHFNLLKPAPM